MHIRFLFVCLVMTMSITSTLAQNSVSFKILDKEDNTPLAGATATVSPSNGAIAGDDGVANLKLTAGVNKIKVTFSFVGYAAQVKTYDLPISEAQPILILMEEESEEMEEIIVTTTRNSRNIEDIPTRIEFLGTEELEEKAVMRSDNIAMLLRESTGIQMQVTSPSSANQSIRIQGLDGRYTQLLKDGFLLENGPSIF